MYLPQLYIPKHWQFAPLLANLKRIGTAGSGHLTRNITAPRHLARCPSTPPPCLVTAECTGFNHDKTENFNECTYPTWSYVSGTYALDHTTFYELDLCPDDSMCSIVTPRFIPVLLGTVVLTNGQTRADGTHECKRTYNVYEKWQTPADSGLSADRPYLYAENIATDIQGSGVVIQQPSCLTGATCVSGDQWFQSALKCSSGSEAANPASEVFTGGTLTWTVS